MKKSTTLVLIISLISNLSFGQASDEIVEEFLTSVNLKNILSIGFENVRRDLESRKEKLFEEYELDYNNQNFLIEFDSSLSEDINFSKQETYVQLSIVYKTKYTNEQLQKYIDLSNDEDYGGNIFIDSNLKHELDSILSFGINNLHNQIHLTLVKFGARSNPLVLKVINEGEETPLSQLNLDLLVNTTNENNKQVSILNTSNSQIFLPENLDFETITSLTIRLNNKDYVIERYDMSLPEEIRDEISPISKDKFDDLEIWTITIDQEVIGLKTKQEVFVER